MARPYCYCDPAPDSTGLAGECARKSPDAAQAAGWKLRGHLGQHFRRPRGGRIGHVIHPDQHIAAARRGRHRPDLSSSSSNSALERRSGHDGSLARWPDTSAGAGNRRTRAPGWRRRCQFEARVSRMRMRASSMRRKYSVLLRWLSASRIAPTQGQIHLVGIAHRKNPRRQRVRVHQLLLMAIGNAKAAPPPAAIQSLIILPAIHGIHTGSFANV